MQKRRALLCASMTLCVLAIAPQRAKAHFVDHFQEPHSAAALATGTFALGTRRQPSPQRDGCWLESAPLTGDSVRVQLRCSTPRSHHIGLLDERLQLRDNGAVFIGKRFKSGCQIAVRFTADRAVVTQHGDDQACGFGAFVNASGDYRRISRGRPPFDLAPIELRHGRRDAL
jgi:hypothetical protein